MFDSKINNTKEDKEIFMIAKNIHTKYTKDQNNYSYIFDTNNFSNNFVFKKKCNKNWKIDNNSTNFIVNGYGCLFVLDSSKDKVTLDFVSKKISNYS